MIQAPTAPQKRVRRACIRLLAAESEDNKEIAAVFHVTVGLCRQRILDTGLAGLQRAPRTGRRKTHAPEQVEKVISGVVRPPKGRDRWGCRTIARHSKLSRSAVQRILATYHLKPHRTRTFELNNDPQIEAKFWDAIGFYLDPPTRATVPRCD